MKYVTLHISSWRGISFGAQHYYGSLHYSGEGVYEERKLRRVLTAKTAKILNDQRGCTEEENRYARFHAGESTECFDSETHVRLAALRKWKKEFPDAVFLLEGQSAVCDPQKCLAGPKDLKKTINAFYLASEKTGGYEGDEKEMSRITDEYCLWLKKVSREAENK